VAESIERIFAEKLHEFYGILAFHYSRAESLEKAEEWLIKAGEEALNSSASDEALYISRKPQNLSPNFEESISIAKRLPCLKRILRWHSIIEDATRIY